MNQIDIYYMRAGGEKKVIPVRYDVEEMKGMSLKILHCTISLPKDEMPNWLYPEKFDLITPFREGLPIIKHDDAREVELRTLDADFFRYKVYNEILFREQQALDESNSGC